MYMSRREGKMRLEMCILDTISDKNLKYNYGFEYSWQSEIGVIFG